MPLRVGDVTIEDWELTDRPDGGGPRAARLRARPGRRGTVREAPGQEKASGIDAFFLATYSSSASRIAGSSAGCS